MDSVIFLNYSIGIGFLLLAGFISFAFYRLSKSLKEATSILRKVDDITKDVESLKNIIKTAILYLMSMFSNKREVNKK